MSELDPDGACECFACRLTGLGFDDDQQILVVQLMEEAHAAGEAGRLIAFKLIMTSGVSTLTPEDLNFAMQRVIEARSQPMSPEVAAAVRGSHR